MRTLLSLLAGLLLSLPALAQVSSDGVTGGPSFYVTTPTNGQCFVFQSATGLWINGSCGGGGTGTVTSVAFADGSTIPIFTVTGSPVTTAGTLTETLATESANAIFAGPTSGGVAQPTFRSLVTADLPSAFGTPGSINLSNATALPCAALPALTSEITSSGCTATITKSITPTWTGLHTWNFTGQAANTQIDAVLLENTTTASSGNQQEVCARLEGQGWGTTAPASATVDWRICVVPVQGTLPQANLVLAASINGGAYTTYGTLGSNGSGTWTIGALNTTTSTSNVYIVAGNTALTNGINKACAAAGAGSCVGFYSNSVQGGDLDSTQHWRLGSTTSPTISSGACGATTNGTLSAASNDHAGEIIIGAAATTTCTVTFAAGYGVVPRAVILTPGNAAAIGATVLPFVSAIATSSFTVTGSLLANTSFYYWVQ